MLAAHTRTEDNTFCAVWGAGTSEMSPGETVLGGQGDTLNKAPSAKPVSGVALPGFLGGTSSSNVASENTLHPANATRGPLLRKPHLEAIASHRPEPSVGLHQRRSRDGAQRTLRMGE